MAGTTLQTLTVAAAVTQNAAATTDTHLVRFGEAKALLAALFQGAYSAATTYSAGQIASGTGGLYASKQNANLNHALTDAAWWTPLLAAATDGQAAYVYVGYASDSSGTGFSTTPSDSLTYMAVKVSTTVISSLQASDFSGLWRNCAGPKGTDGDDGANGTNGVSAYVYIRYASDSSGTGFSTTPASGLGYVAIKTAATAIANPSASDFTGLWKQYVIAKTDDLPEGASPTNLWFTAARVLAAVLTGLSATTGGDLAVTDSVLAAFGKLQKRLKDLETSEGVAAAEGTIALSAGVQTGAVTGLALTFTPARVQLTVEVPSSNSLGLMAVVVGAVTPDGFGWALMNGAPDAAGYKIHYRIS